MYSQRGLPHVHILIILCNEDKFRTSDDIDKKISAEIPDKEQDEELYNLVSNMMMHGPCGHLNPTNVCMQNGHCKNNFPRAYRETTDVGDDSYALYRRRNDGRTVKKIIRINNTPKEVTLDNRYVISYCPELLRFIKSHCNVEVCASIKAVKYM